MIKPIQKILFGSPGTGKSYQVRQIAEDDLGIEWDEESRSLKNTIKTVFHPEYTYSDFMGKLLPLTEGNNVIYKFYPGHFLQALGMAYKEIIEGEGQNVLLVIDELNRGNAAAIFGPVFQLLDRDEDWWSSYDVNISELEMVGLLKSVGLTPTISGGIVQIKKDNGSNVTMEDYFNEKNVLKQENDSAKILVKKLIDNKICIPSNLSIIATINTSDESIYYLDSAFKRRWDWKYFEASDTYDEELVPEEIKNVTIAWEQFEKDEEILEMLGKIKWWEIVVGLNDFIKDNYKNIRRIEDKQIGWWFLKPEDNKISQEAIENKLMFYLWDSVFSKNRRVLEDFLSDTPEKKVRLITFGDFVDHSYEFVSELIKKYV